MNAAERLRRAVGWEGLGVDWAVLFGSAAEGGGRDVDVFVRARDVESLVEVALAAKMLERARKRNLDP